MCFRSLVTPRNLSGILRRKKTEKLVPCVTHQSPHGHCSKSPRALLKVTTGTAQSPHGTFFKNTFFRFLAKFEPSEPWKRYQTSFLGVTRLLKHIHTFDGRSLNKNSFLPSCEASEFLGLVTLIWFLFLQGNVVAIEHRDNICRSLQIYCGLHTTLTAG